MGNALWNVAFFVSAIIVIAFAVNGYFGMWFVTLVVFSALAWNRAESIDREDNP